MDDTEQDRSGSRQSILVVDDSPANLIAYRAILEPLGHEIVTARSGREAVDLLAEQQFALLLIDVRMPDIDGFATVELLRDQLRRLTPVIFITGDDNVAAMRRAYEFGAVDYLMKPIQAEVLRGKVRNLLALYVQGLELERRTALLMEQHRRLLEADATLRRQDTNIGVLAHDLRTPLSAISTGASLLTRIADLPPRAREIAERIDRSAQRMAAMIADILDFTRGRLAGGIPLSCKPLDLGALSQAVAEEVQAAHPTAKIDVATEGTLEGEWDEARIEQAVSNLVANAVQHGRGEVSVIASGEDPALVTLTVRNGGTPIPADALPKLFEPFQRGGGKSRAGLGLGLYIVREIVLAHGGTIDVASSEAGTFFEVRLPRRTRPDREVSRFGTGADSAGDERRDH